jgi:hypothetical protein
MQNAVPRLAEPREVPWTDNPFAAAGAPLPVTTTGGGGGLVSIESQRALAEVQARMMLARANPRDAIRAYDAILNDCARPGLAKRAIYQYARGGTDIKGPSIRLAEAIAQRWGNIASGIKIIARHGDMTDCIAYAWDMESNFYDERPFQVRHWRDTRQGGYALTDERDIYELIANMGQRRKRAVLLTVIPGDVVEAAQEQCERTLRAKADTSPAGIKLMLDSFAEFGVTQAQIEARIQRRLDAIQPAQYVQIEQIYTSLKDDMSQVADWFDAVPAPVEAEGGDQPPRGGPTGAAQPEAGQRRRGRPPRQQQASADPPAGDPRFEGGERAADPEPPPPANEAGEPQKTSTSAPAPGRPAFEFGA